MYPSVVELRESIYYYAWVQRKLTEVVSISAGGDVDKTKLTEEGEYPVLANALTNSGIVGYYDSYKVEAPAVTVTGRGDVGHAVARHVNFTPVVRLLSLKSDVLDADFLANMLNQTNILVESTGVPQLTAPQLGSYKISYPNFNEQTKIGQLLNAFDNLIAANQKHRIIML
ncbi:restriction endonuclease subunit S [Weissella confusa]|uniref:restriction endonuclease subunit S n=1 Tax=Weissella confusa TaxID=1583 RepID=UPI001080A705|nr:restriction endonuclease subunit S [Weissella confusa]TGE70340.1 type I restriction endonuclease subunit S [Weissella confusa]